MTRAPVLEARNRIAKRVMEFGKITSKASNNGLSRTSPGLERGLLGGLGLEPHPDVHCEYAQLLRSKLYQGHAQHALPARSNSDWKVEQ